MHADPVCPPASQFHSPGDKSPREAAKSSVRRAAIDIGTNSVKILVADVTGSQIEPVFEIGEQTRLGRGFYQTHTLQPAAIQLTAETVARFAQQAKELGAVSVRALATSAARDAHNSGDLRQAIREAAGLEIEIISGLAEAEMSFAGLCSRNTIQGTVLALDVGGGSTEFMLGSAAGLAFRQSAPLGSVRLLEKLTPSPAPSAEDLAHVRQWLRDHLHSGENRVVLEEVRRASPGLALGVGGTTALLALIHHRHSEFDTGLIESTTFTPESLAALEQACARERCPFAVVGTATLEQQLVVEDTLDNSLTVNMPMPVLLGKPPRMQRKAQRAPSKFPALDTSQISLAEAAERVLRLPGVASKNFLITIGDRTVGGLTVRDQMVGPWQVPVADCAVTATAFTTTTGEAMSMGERPLLALLNAPASGRMAVGEAITNIAAANISKLSDVRLSANWMAACGQNDEDARLFDTVRTVGSELCPELGIAIPVGKDSLSMKSVWQQNGETHTQTSPLSVVISAFAPVADVRKSLTPQLRGDAGETRLILVDLGNGKNRLGGSALAQVFGEVGDVAPDLDHPQQLKAAFDAVQSLNGAGLVLAYHDRSDGGLYVTLGEMSFAGHVGINVSLDALGVDPLAALFNEELGMVLQVRAADAAAVLKQLHAAKLTVHDIGSTSDDGQLRFMHNGQQIYAVEREALHKIWAETSARIAALRDEPDCVREEFANVGASNDPGLHVQLSFDPNIAPAILKSRPRVAILREQGVNGQVEMAWAFDAAGFDAIDVHMTDVLGGRVKLDDFKGLVACGGFSYGDVLGAGQGWAKTILFNARARDEFQAFLAGNDKFALGVCNGCQMFAALKDIVPGAQNWPAFRRNRSEQFEARWTMVEIVESKSLFLAGMEGSRMPIAVAHGEGRAVFSGEGDLDAMVDARQVGLTFIDNNGNVAESYPQNPNGSPAGLTGICNDDGRVTIMMPHPERTIAGTTGSYWPQANGEFTPWMQMFRNARKWVG